MKRLPLLAAQLGEGSHEQPAGLVRIAPRAIGLHLGGVREITVRLAPTIDG